VDHDRGVSAMGHMLPDQNIALTERIRRRPAGCYHPPNLTLIPALTV
jgi:hypothetical protein